MSPGTRIDDPVLQARGPELATQLVETYLHQFFVAGVFHGDPHPGNLFVLADGRICLHDFGLVGYLDRRTRANLLAFMLAFVQQDGAWLLDGFVELGMMASSCRCAITGSTPCAASSHAAAAASRSRW